jgi:xanthosine utilization system XapX-like protein
MSHRSCYTLGGPLTRGEPTRADTSAANQRNPQLDLLVAYHASARAELVSRLSSRDSALFLYLAAVATIFGVVATDWSHRAPSLLVVPLLGLGATLVYAQHNTVIGALGLYLGRELHEVTQRITGSNDVVRSWDASKTLKSTRSHISSRLASGLVLLLGPSASSCILVLSERPSGLIKIGVVTGALLTFWSAIILVRSHRSRAAFRALIV